MPAKPSSPVSLTGKNPWKLLECSRLFVISEFLSYRFKCFFVPLGIKGFVVNFLSQLKPLKITVSQFLSGRTL
jgi:hypothetical protein